MINKITMSLLAAAAVTAFSFTTGEKHLTTYKVDTKSTTASWVGKKVTGEHSGTIAVSSGNIISDHGNITGGAFILDMTSLKCTDLKADEGGDKLVGHLKADDFFGADKHPTAKFELTKATLKSGNDYDVTGKLTIKGITNEVTFPAMIKMDGKTFVTVAKITVDRTKYDIKYGSASFFQGIGDKAISDNFELNVNVVASAESGK
ncbi:MAG: YceI family protein [Bacteroidota bacterium]|nr:YceI family protein [Bacteroidota bacterium]